MAYGLWPMAYGLWPMAYGLITPMGGHKLLQGPATAVPRLPSELLPRPLGLHQHFLAHGVDPGELGWGLRQPGDHLGGGAHGQLGHGYRVPAEGVSQVAHPQGAAAREVVGAGWPLAEHARHERRRHVILVHELEARSGVGDH